MTGTAATTSTAGSSRAPRSSILTVLAKRAGRRVWPPARGLLRLEWRLLGVRLLLDLVERRQDRVEVAGVLGELHDRGEEPAVHLGGELVRRVVADGLRPVEDLRGPLGHVIGVDIDADVPVGRDEAAALGPDLLRLGA